MMDWSSLLPVLTALNRRLVQSLSPPSSTYPVVPPSSFLTSQYHERIPCQSICMLLSAGMHTDVIFSHVFLFFHRRFDPTSVIQWCMYALHTILIQHQHNNNNNNNNNTNNNNNKQVYLQLHRVGFTYTIHTSI